MTTYSPETRALLDALSRQTIAYHPDLAATLGSIPAAVILGQLLYWHGKQADPDGWIMKTAKDFEAETAITERQQETVRAILVGVGAVKFERRGIPAMPFYKIDHDKIISLYVNNAGVKNPQVGETKNPPRSILKFPRLGDSNTEITTEITSNTTRASGAAAGRAVPILGFAQIAHKEADVPFSENSLDQFQTMMGRKDKLWSERMKAPEAIRDIAVSVSQALGIVPTKSQLPFWAKGAAELYEVLAGDPALIGAAVADMRGKGLSMSSPKSLVTTVQRLKAAPAASISQGTDFQRAQRAALEAELRGAA